jgi:methylated-DNA-[protein]-cysteine S-methyltransferase
LHFQIRKLDGVWFGIASKDQRIFATNFGIDRRRVIDGINRVLRSKAVTENTQEDSSFTENVFSNIKKIYDGLESTEEIPLAMEYLPVYSQRVLRTVARVPVGYVTSYGAVAETVGGGARAVGNIMASNPFAPVVPCHRVVTSSLGLGGYGGGFRVKYEFLEREKRGFTKQRNVLIEDRIIRVNPVEFVLEKYSKRNLQDRGSMS